MKRIFLIFSICILNFDLLAQQIVQLEYFIDIDAGIGKNSLVNVVPAISGTFPFTANLSNMPAGYHLLYIRTKNSDGKWSQTTRQTIEVIGISTNVVAAEYFFNTDPGIGNAHPINFNNPANNSSFTFMIPPENIPDSINGFYVRVKDDAQRWSLTQWQKDSVTTVVSGSNLWSNPLTWSTGKIPDVNTVIVLRKPVIVDITAICKSLVPIGSGVQITVNPGKVLTITGH